MGRPAMIYHRRYRGTASESCPPVTRRMWTVILVGLVVLVGCARGQFSDASTATPSPSTPPPLTTTCYFCVNVSSNEECNLFAIDISCSKGLTVCLNTHVMDHEGRTVLVDKKCATERLCSSQVGCRRAGDQKICVSCCDAEYCNEDVARNDSSAIFQRTRQAAYSGSPTPRRPADAFHSIWILSSITATLLTV